MSDASAIAAAPSAGRNVWLHALRWCVLAVVVWFIGKTVLAALAHDSLRPRLAEIHYGWLLAAGIVYFLAQIPAGVFWYRVLHALGQRPRPVEAFRAFYIGHLGKYVPGKAMAIVIRVGLLPSARAGGAMAVLAVFVETLTTMAVGGSLAAGVLVLLYPHHHVLVAAAFGLMLLAGLPTLPPVLRFGLRNLPGRVARLAAAAPLDRMNFGLLAGGWLGIALGWVLLGLSLWATLRGLGAGDLPLAASLPTLTASVALAVVAGFLSMIPGGALVREMVLAQILAEIVSPELALVSAVLLRLVWLAAELFFAALLYFWPGAASD